MDNLEEMDKFLERYNLPRLNQEERDNRDKPITSTKIETGTKNHPRSKSLGSDGLTGEFYQIFKEQLTPILLKLFQKILEEGTLPISFYEATIILIPKPDKDIKKKKRKLQSNITDEPTRKNPQQNINNPNPTIH